MTDFLKKIEGFDISKAMSTVRNIDPLQQTYNQIQERNNELTRSIVENNIRKAEEVERRHKELVEASKNSNPNVTINIIGDNANGQIQQGLTNTQTVSITQEFNYERVSEVLEAIKGQFDNPSFNSDLGDDAEEIKQIVTETLELVKRKEDPTVIKYLLGKAYTLADKVTISMIATGIVGLIKGLLT